MSLPWHCCEKCQEKDFDGWPVCSAFEDEDVGSVFEDEDEVSAFYFENIRKTKRKSVKLIVLMVFLLILHLKMNKFLFILHLKMMDKMNARELSEKRFEEELI